MEVFNEIESDLKFTVEIEEDFEDGWLPTLDTKLKMTSKQAAVQPEPPQTETETNPRGDTGRREESNKSPQQPASPKEYQVENQKLDSHRRRAQQVPRELPAKSVERCLAMEHQVPRDQQ